MSRCESREGEESGKEEQLEQRVGQVPLRGPSSSVAGTGGGVGRRGRERRLQVEGRDQWSHAEPPESLNREAIR